MRSGSLRSENLAETDFLPAPERHTYDGVRRRIYSPSGASDAHFRFVQCLKLVQGVSRPGCTGHEVKMLLSLAMPAGVGVLSSDTAWFTGLVMTLPPVMIFWSDSWQEGLIGYGVFYLANVGLVLMGRAMRQRVVITLVRRLRPSWRERAART